MDGPDDWAGEGHPEMRSTKVPTKSGTASPLRPLVNRLKQEQFSIVSGDKVGIAGTDDNLDNEVAGAALRTHPNGAAAGGRRLRRCCLLSETP